MKYIENSPNRVLLSVILDLSEIAVLRYCDIECKMIDSQLGQ